MPTFGMFKYVLVVLALYFASFFGSLYMLFPYLPVLFFDRKLFHSLSDFSLKLWFGLCVFMLENVCGIKMIIHQSKANNFKNAKSSIVIMNHRTRLDWLFYFCVLYRLNALDKIKIILKDDLKQVPGPNWAMQTALFIFIKRKWDLDRVTFDRFLDYFRDIKKNVMILIFPEGTNLTDKTKTKSNEFAAKHGLPTYEKVLHPRTAGFSYIINKMIDNRTIDCVNDVSIAYKGGKVPENELDLIRGNLPREIHFYLDDFDLRNVLNDNLYDNNNNKEHSSSNQHKKILEDWLVKRWEAKEHLLAKFYHNETKELVNDGSYEENASSNESSSFIKYLYPAYWLLSALAMIYLIYNYKLVQFYFIVAFLFYVYTQLFTSGLDNFIIDFESLKSADDLVSSYLQFPRFFIFFMYFGLFVSVAYVLFRF